MEQITVKPGDSGQRLDKYLGKYLKEAPKTKKEYYAQREKSPGK